MPSEVYTHTYLPKSHLEARGEEGVGERGKQHLPH